MSIKEIKIDFFDLRRPQGFLFFSLYGFLIYGIVFISLNSTPTILNNECIDAFPDIGNLSKKCGISAWVIIYQSLFFLVSYIFISSFKKPEWSAEAIFNSLSILIILISGFTVLLYVTYVESASIMVDYYKTYFIIISAISLIFCRSIVLWQRSVFNLKKLFVPEQDEIRLLVIYFVLASGYAILAIYISPQS